MTFDLETKFIYAFIRIGYYWMNKKTSKIYHVLCNCWAYFILAFLSSYMVKSGCNIYQAGKNIEYSDLWIKLISAHQNLSFALKNNSRFKGAFAIIVYEFQFSSTK